MGSSSQNAPMPRLMMFISSLGGGGAERVFTELANHFSELGHPVFVVTLSNDQSDAYPLDAGLTRLGMDNFRPSSGPFDALLQNIRRVIVLRRIIKDYEPKAVLGFLSESNIVLIFATLGLDCRVVISERNYPPNESMGRIWQWLRKISYRKAELLVVLSEKTVLWAKDNIRTRNISVIENPVVWPLKDADPHVSINSLVETSNSVILAVGRLADQKGFDHLIRAFRESSLSNFGWKLVIVGSEPELGSVKNMLNHLVEQYGLSSAVLFPGRVGNMSAWYQAADIFVLSSRYEGFPNALIEAMACGKPVISTRCDTGPEDIIEHGKSGLLVPVGDVESLANAMSKLANDKQLRSDLSRHAVHVIDRYDRKAILEKWTNALFPSLY